jgi:hypothetical protein
MIVWEKARATVWTRCADVCGLGVDVDVVGIVVPDPCLLGPGGALCALRRGCDEPMAIHQDPGETVAYCRRRLQGFVIGGDPRTRQFWES